MSINWSLFAEIIRKHQRFLLVCHIRPDCDALGSQSAMAQILEKLGKTVSIVNGHPVPPNLAFIDPRRRVRVLHRDVEPSELTGFDCLMVLDTSSWAQLGPMGEVLKTTRAEKIVLDHHQAGDDIGAIEFKDPHFEATGRLVAVAAEKLGVELTPEIASALFAAIATDTGWFRFQSVLPETFTTVAKLIEVGASPAAVYRELYERDTLGRVRLRGLILSRFQTELDGKLVHTYVRKEDFQATGSLPSDTEDIINMGLAVEGSQVAFIMVEQLTGGFKISFRSRCELDCAELAKKFGGGGHKGAAGAFINAPFDETRAMLLKAVVDATRRDCKEFRE